MQKLVCLEDNAPYASAGACRAGFELPQPKEVTTAHVAHAAGVARAARAMPIPMQPIPSMWSIPSVRRTHQQRAHQLRQVFKRFDIDGSGSIEVERVLHVG